MSQLTNYIQKELEKGFSEKLIKEKLLKAGYTEQEIKESFRSLKSAEPLLRRKLPEYLHADVHVQWSKWVFPLLALGVAVFFGYLVYLYAVGEVGIEEVVTDCDTLVDGREKDICLLQLAAAGEDVCGSMQSVPFKQACFGRVWELEDCTYELLIGEDMETCLLQKAIATRDASYCDRTEDFRVCRAKLAEMSGDISFCQENLACITTISVKEQNPDYCQDIYEDEFLRRCYDFYTKATGETSLCSFASFGCGFEELQTKEEKRSYIQENLYKLPSTEKLDEDLIDYTIEFLDPIFCEFSSETFMYNEISAKELCIMAYAYNAENVVACQTLAHATECQQLLECRTDSTISDMCDLVEG